MKARILFLILFLTTLYGVKGEMVPTPGIETIPDYPIFYVNTQDNTPIDQKEVYIDAEAWLDPQATGRCEAVGSEEKPLVLGIRGRGNASWNVDGAKPYKMKFDKKQSFFGKVKNKHWVLLPLASYQEYYNNLVGFHMAKQLGLPFQPDRFPVQLVLNGQFLGIYMLSEHVRIDEGRVDIYEQSDLNEDDATIPYGWLVEIDNYDDPCQIQVPSPGKENSFLRLTYHTPELLSSKQHDWLQNTFDTITALAYGNILDTSWQKYIDAEDFAKYFIVQETLHNLDGFRGSSYLYKDMCETDTTWHFGPLWDMSYTFDREKTYLIVQGGNGRADFFSGKLADFPSFRQKAVEIFNEYLEEYGTDWIDEFCDSLYADIDKGFLVTEKIWTEVPFNRMKNRSEFARKYFKDNTKWMKNFFAENWQTHNVGVDIQYNDDIEGNVALLPGQIEGSKDVKVLIDNLEMASCIVNHGQTVNITFLSDYGRYPSEILLNDMDITDRLEGNTLILPEIDEDIKLAVVFGPPTQIPPTEVELNFTEIELLPGQTMTLQAVLHPENTTLSEIKWTSSDSEVAEVDSEGNILAQAPGEAYITAETINNLTAGCLVKVNSPEMDYGDEECLIFERLYASLDKPLSVQAYLENPENIAYYTVYEKNNCVSVDSVGTVLCSAYGESIVRAKDSYGRTKAYFDIFCGPKISVVSGIGASYTHHALVNSRPALTIDSVEGYDISGITVNGEEYDLGSMSDNQIVFTQPVVNDVVINLTLQKQAFTNDSTIDLPAKVSLYVADRKLTIENKTPEARVVICDTAGLTVYDSTDDTFYFDLPGVYMVQISNQPSSFKIYIP